MPTTSPFLTCCALSALASPLHVVEELGVGQVAFLALLDPPVDRDPVPAAGVGHLSPPGEVGRRRELLDPQ